MYFQTAINSQIEEDVSNSFKLKVVLPLTILKLNAEISPDEINILRL